MSAVSFLKKLSIFDVYTLLYLFIIYLFLAVHDFSSCGEWAILFSCSAQGLHCSGFSRSGVQTLGHLGVSSRDSSAQ